MNGHKDRIFVVAPVIVVWTLVPVVVGVEMMGTVGVRIGHWRY